MALLDPECQDLRPATRTKLLARNTICRNSVEEINFVVVKHSLQAFFLSHANDAFDGIKKPPRRFLAQKLLEETPHDVDRQVRLRDTLGIAFRRELRQVFQAALKHIQRMQHTNADAIGEIEYNSAPLDPCGLKPNNAAQKVDLFDALSVDVLAEFCCLGRRIVNGGLPVSPAQRLQ